MKFFSLAIVLWSALLACGQDITPTPSPSPDTESTERAKEQEKAVIQLLDSAVSDAGSLRLAQNRALVYGITGDLYWKFDEKRARALFHNSATEMLNANAEAETESRNNRRPNFGQFFTGDIRYQIIPLAAKHDPALALEMLRQTRPPKLAEEMAKYLARDPKQAIPDRGGFNPQTAQAQQEANLDQQFSMMAAANDPDKVADMLKDAIAKGISPNVLPLLQKVYAADEKKGMQFADQLVAKVSDTDLAKQPQDLNSVIAILRSATTTQTPQTPPQTQPVTADIAVPTKQFSFNDVQLRSMANKVVDTFMLPSNPPAITASMSRALPTLEKIVPEKAALLEQKQAATSGTGGGLGRGGGRQQAAIDPKATPESILAQLPTMNDFQRAGAYQTLSSKIAQIDDDARANQLIDQIPDADARQRAQDQYQAGKVARATQSGNLDDAQRMIGAISQKSTQIQKLVSLAVEFHNKGGDKDIDSANSLMKQAKAMVTQPFEDGDDLNDLLEVIKGYGVVDPDTAFNLFDTVAEEINEVVQASAVLSKYSRNDRNFKKGELVMRVGGFPGDTIPLYRCMPQIQMLAKVDIARAGLISDKMMRQDTKTLIKLFAAQGFLSDGMPPSQPTGRRQGFFAAN